MSGNHNAHQAYRALELTPLPECELTKTQMLDILMLLSALESWGLVTSNGLPKYLHERVESAIELLRNEVMK